MLWPWSQRRVSRPSRRRLRFEPLEPRRVLADLGIGVTLTGDNPSDAMINVGKVGAPFTLDIKVRDIRTAMQGNPVGVVSLPLHVSWDPRFVQIDAGGLTDPALIDALVRNVSTPPVVITSSFPLQRALDAFNAGRGPFPVPDPTTPLVRCDGLTPVDFEPCANLQGLRGASLPNAMLGAAIGAAGEESFATIQLRAAKATETLGDARFTIRLAGSMAFADASPLGAVVSGSNTSDVPNANDLLTVQTILRVDPAIVRGMKFNDLDGDGTKDAGEPGLLGWEIELIRDTNGNGQRDTGEPVVGTSTTDVNGNYQLPINDAGTYLVREVLQPGWRQTTTNPAPITTAGTDFANVDFGNQRVESASLSGAVFADTNRNGIFESTEDGLPNVTVRIMRTDVAGAPVLTAVTGPDGSYRFTNLPPGIYEITESQPAGFVNASITRGQVVPAGQSQPCTGCQGSTDGLNRFVSIDLRNGGIAADYLFGENVIPTKRRFLSSVDRFRETCAQLAVRCVTVQGTAGNDTITYEPTDNEVRITINAGPVQEFSRNQVDIVKIDAGAGTDTVTLRGSNAVDTAHVTADTCSLQSGSYGAGGYAVVTTNAERTTVDGRAGSDRAVIRDSAGDDVLRGFMGPVRRLEIALGVGRTATLSNFEQIQAVSLVRPGITELDTATLNGLAVDLVGKWTIL